MGACAMEAQICFASPTHPLLNQNNLMLYACASSLPGWGNGKVRADQIGYASNIRVVQPPHKVRLSNPLTPPLPASKKSESIRISISAEFFRCHL